MSMYKSDYIIVLAWTSTTYMTDEYPSLPLCVHSETGSAVACCLHDHFFFFSSRRRHTRFDCDWSSDVCSSDLSTGTPGASEVPATASSLQGSGSQITSLSSDTLLTHFSSTQENQGLDRMALFVPGVVNSRSNNFSNVNGVPFSVNGLRWRNNDQQIDGQSNNDSLVTGPSAALTDPNFVEQYVITTSNFGPEYGRNSGAVVNLITKSGTNAWHGSLYGNETHSAFN